MNNYGTTQDMGYLRETEAVKRNIENMEAKDRRGIQ